MTDPAERRSLVPRGTFDPNQPTRDTEPDPVDAPLHSYIDELRTGVESLPDLDDAALDDALMVPPGAAPRTWVATDIESALHAAAETVPRAPSSPDAPTALVPAAPGLHTAVPAAALAPRHVRRPARELVDDFPVELDGQGGRTLRSRERGRKSGRFTSPAGLRASLEAGSIAAAVKGLVDAERASAAGAPSVGTKAWEPEPLSETALEAAAAMVLPAPVMSACEAVESVLDAIASAPDAVDGSGDGTPSRLATVSRVIALFATASIAGGTAVYFLLHG